MIHDYNGIKNLDKLHEIMNIDNIVQEIIPSLIEISNNKNWRIRNQIAETIPVLARILNKKIFMENILNICIKWLNDPVYAIRVLSSYSKTFSNNEFEQIWAQAKQQNEEGTVSADYGQLVKGSVGNMESYSRATTYHGESDSYWRLIVLNNFMTGQIAILSCWYSNENDIPIDKIVAGIRF